MPRIVYGHVAKRILSLARALKYNTIVYVLLLQYYITLLCGQWWVRDTEDQEV